MRPIFSFSSCNRESDNPRDICPPTHSDESRALQVQLEPSMNASVHVNILKLSNQGRWRSRVGRVIVEANQVQTVYSHPPH